MMMDKLKAIGKKKIVLIIGGILLVIALLVLINWDRIQYRRAIAEFYGNYGNIYVMDNARVPKDIRHKYYEERFQELGKTEEEYREEAEEAYKNSGVRCKYKILRAENLIRLYKFWPDNKVHITDLEDFKDKFQSLSIV